MKIAVKPTFVWRVCQSTRKELYEKYKSLWQTLSDSKKLRYIKMAIEAKKKYDVCLAFVFSYDVCLQCFDAVGWVAGRASGL